MPASKSRIEVKGVREVQAAMRGLEVDAKDLSAAHKAVVTKLVPGIALRSPRRSGRLASSWRAAATKTRGKLTSTAPYAGVIEYGWAAHGIEPARMVRETIEGSTDEILATYADELAKLAEKQGFRVVKT